ncbi:MAG: BREX-4 system phosphatase PglZ [Bacillota bacterium]
MTISEVVSKVSNERQTPGRFPTRLIFAHNFPDYLSLVGELKAVCDAVIDLADYTKGDVLPRFKDFKGEIARHSGKQLLLLSFGEYLRICIKRERDKTTAAFPGMWEQQQSENSTTKYIIPIFGGREIFDSIMPIQDERQQRFIWEVNESSAESEYGLALYSPDFADAVTVDAENLQEWFQKWTSLFGDKSRNSFSLRTKLYRYAEPTYGGVRLSIIDEPFAYVVSLVTDSERLKKTDGSEELWRFIAHNVKQGKAFAETIKHLLNIGHSFDPISVLARFNELSDTELSLLLIWYKIYPSDDYYTFAINKASTAAAIPVTLRDSIFALPKLTDAFIQQRTSALRVLDISYSDDYFAKLDKLASPESRLMMLTYRTLAERAYAVKTVSSLLRSGADVNTVAELVKNEYPDLAEYMNPGITASNEVTQYFNWYRRSKLVNRPNTDVPCVIDFDSIDSRNKIIQENATNDSLTFWVDGLGAEWIPVLLSRLKALEIEVSLKPVVTKALLPTETEYNHRWTSEDKKWDRLDKISHNGMPDDKDYFLCIARQLEIMNEIVEHVAEMLTKVNRVIVTGDHGSSRLAALLFHDEENFAVEPPKNAIVRSFGRFVELRDDSYVSVTPSMERRELDGKHFIVMKTYEHFKQSGNAAGGNTDENAVAGEVHGGMTPEEYLVPVIVVSRKKPLPPKEIPKKPKGITINNDMLGLP